MPFNISDLNSLEESLSSAAAMGNTVVADRTIALVTSAALLKIARLVSDVPTAAPATGEYSAPHLSGIDENSEPAGIISVGHLTALVYRGEPIAAVADSMSEDAREWLIKLLGGTIEADEDDEPEDDVEDDDELGPLATYAGPYPVRVRDYGGAEGMAQVDTTRNDEGSESVVVVFDNGHTTRTWVDRLVALKPGDPFVGPGPADLTDEELALVDASLEANDNEGGE